MTPERAASHPPPHAVHAPPPAPHAAHAPRPPSTPRPLSASPPTPRLVLALRPLLAAEAAAEAPAAGTEPGDLEQAVWLRLLERLAAHDPPPDPPRWLRAAVRAEARRSRRAHRLERPYVTEPADDGRYDPERLALAAAHGRALREAVRRLPGRCPRLLDALLSPRDLTYREIAGELGISQGGLGPERSRCLGCLRRLLTSEVAAR